MSASNMMSEIKTGKQIKRTEEYPTILESYARECPNGKREKKRICKALPKDGNNGTQQKKLSKNTAKKRKRAQQMESTTSIIE